MPCKQCNSIGQYIIDNYGEDYLWKHWSSNNSNNPFAISKGSGKKIWIHCTKKSYHPDYLQEAKSFAKGCRCPYCTSKIILPQDSLASKFPKSINYWSNKNPKSPYEYSAHSGDEVW